jgi:PAS domain S-box-containing protein
MNCTPASLESVLSTAELAARPSRPPDYESENRALVALAQHLADSPRTILQKLAEVALDVCRAGSAGVSLISNENGDFYWPAISGAWKLHIGGGTPRNFGPCGTVLDRNAMQLFTHPERYFPYLAPVTPPIEEALLTPFYVEGEAVGTVWVIAHDARRKFDSEDLRQIESLSRFAEAAHQVWAALDAQGQHAGAMRDMNQSLLVSSLRQHELTAQAEKAEAALRESGERFHSVADNIPQMAWMVDDQCRFEWFNRVWLEYTGTTLDDCVGEGWNAVHHPDYVDAVTEKFRRHLREGKDWEDTFPLRGKDGRYRWFLSRMKAIRDESGTIVRFFGTNTDVTEQREAKDLLLASETRYRRLFEAAHDGILILDAQTAKVVEVNRRMLDLLRQPREYFLGKELWELGVFRDKQQNQEAMRQLQRDRLIRYEDLPLQDRDGRRVPVEFVSNIYQEDNHPVIQCIIRDISERKRFEDEREAHLINEQSLRMEAEAANRSKDMFLATLSHEMRTPLNAIVGWISILRSGPTDEADLKEGLDVIDRNTKAQVQLIEDVLDVSRIVSGKLRLEIRACDLIEIIKAGIDVVRPAAEARRITLDAQLESSAGRAMCDGMRIQQVVWNLVSNAVKFTPKGGRVRVVLARDHSSWRIEVSDNGQGIPSDLVPYVFDRFRQADSSTRRKFGGLGLGLSIVKHLVEMHGGTVQVISAGAGKGSTFTVRLPVRAVRMDESADVTDTTDAEDIVVSGLPVVRLDGLRVFVVDDEADARRLLMKVLEGAGAIVTTAASAEEAMAALPKAHPEVLVSDLGMPGEDGFDLIRRVRGSGLSVKELPAVALTAFVHKDDQREALLAGFQVHVPKPVDPHDLTAVIATLAGRTGIV